MSKTTGCLPMSPEDGCDALAQRACCFTSASMRLLRTCTDRQDDDHDHSRSHHSSHLNPSYAMDLDRPDFNPYSSLGQFTVPGNSAGMNDISALAAAASDQLYELERHEAFRRAEYELRHRQIAGARGTGSKSNGNSPAGTPNNNGTSSNIPFGGAYGFSNERERWGLSGMPGPGGAGNIVYPVSPAQPATNNHPAVPAGTLADPTYLVPPTCCHEECHKSYRKRLKVAKQTAACPNCLSVPNGGGGHGGGGGGGGHGGHGHGGSDSHHSSSSNTPKDRSTKNSSEDLTKLGGGGLGGGGGGANSYALHNNLHQQLARLQQQHHLALQKAHAQQAQQAAQQAAAATAAAQINPYKPLSSSQHHIKPYTLDLHAHRGLLGSAAPSRAASPDSDDSSDDEPMFPSGSGGEFPATSPVLTGMRSMSLFQQGRATTAPVSAATSPIHSRAPSRATSPVEGGHSANSGKHGHGSHQARDAKNRSHPYSTHFSMTTPNSPHFGAAPSSKHRMSPPRLTRTLSGNHVAHPVGSHSHGSHGGHHSSHSHRSSYKDRERDRHSIGSAAGGNGSSHDRESKSVEDILNSSGIPPPPPHSDRTLPPPNSSSSFSGSGGVPSVSFSLSSSQPPSAHASPANSRASSPVHATNPYGSHGSHAHNHLAHSVRAAFGMTPMGGSGGIGVGSKSGGGSGQFGQSPPNRLAPMSGGIGVGMGGSSGFGALGGGHGGHGHGHGHAHGSHGHGHGHGHQEGKVVLPSFSRGSSPVHLMEVDGHA